MAPYFPAFRASQPRNCHPCSVSSPHTGGCMSWPAACHPMAGASARHTRPCLHNNKLCFDKKATLSVQPNSSMRSRQQPARPAHGPHQVLTMPVWWYVRGGPNQFQYWPTMFRSCGQQRTQLLLHYFMAQACCSLCTPCSLCADGAPVAGCSADPPLSYTEQDLVLLNRRASRQAAHHTSSCRQTRCEGAAGRRPVMSRAARTQH